jgi:transcriptional regulator with XRE-family HTH domain
MKCNEAEKILAFVIQNMQAERESQGLSLQQLGALSGVSRTAIGMIEKGERSPSLVICLRVADALGINLGELVAEAISMRQRKAGRPR